MEQTEPKTLSLNLATTATNKHVAIDTLLLSYT